MSEKTKRLFLSFREKYEIIEEVKTGISIESTLWKYRITDRLYNLVSEPEVSESQKMRIQEKEIFKNEYQYLVYGLKKREMEMIKFKPINQEKYRRKTCVTVKLPAPKKCQYVIIYKKLDSVWSFLFY